MGTWFSNLHIRKNGTITQTSVADYIRNFMTAQQYLPAASGQEADVAFAIISDPQSQWVSVYSDLFSFDGPKQFADFASPMSAGLQTDILGIACFDSDYLFLNLINTADKTDAWAAVGNAAGLDIRKRTNLSAWKSKVSDFDDFKESLKKKYVFAEETLADIAHCLHLPQEHGAASYEYLADLELNEQAAFLYFKLPETMKTQDLPRLMLSSASLMPCFLNKPSIVNAINVGGASKGLSVYFVGPYVEHEEITFSDVCFVQLKNLHSESIPFALKKIQLPDGQWAYYYHDPGYRILPKVDGRLSPMKQLRAETERSIVVRFVPHGDPRKILDITVVLVPDKNPQGQIGWNVWHQFGSKKAYIQYHNSTWNKNLGNNPNGESLLLREEDFD